MVLFSVFYSVIILAFQVVNAANEVERISLPRVNFEEVLFLNDSQLLSADVSRKQIKILSNGKEIQSFGGRGISEGRFSSITDLHLSDGILYVLDAEAPKISIFDLSDSNSPQLLREIKIHSSAFPESEPKCIQSTLDSDGATQFVIRYDERIHPKIGSWAKTALVRYSVTEDGEVSSQRWYAFDGYMPLTKTSGGSYTSYAGPFKLKTLSYLDIASSSLFLLDNTSEFIQHILLNEKEATSKEKFRIVEKTLTLSDEEISAYVDARYSRAGTDLQTFLKREIPSTIPSAVSGLICRTDLGIILLLQTPVSSSSSNILALNPVTGETIIVEEEVSLDLQLGDARNGNLLLFEKLKREVIILEASTLRQRFSEVKSISG